MKPEIQKLIDWANKKSWRIFFGPSWKDSIDYFERDIHINNKLSDENKLYTLLHECGHLLLISNKSYKTKYPYSYKIDNFAKRNRKLTNCKKYQFDLISEEIDAWKKGSELAKKLKININKERYRNEMIKSVFTYIQSSVEK